MSTPIMRNGRLVGNPLAGGDLAKLKTADQRDVLDVITKAEAGRLLSLDDLSTVMKARKVSGATAPKPATISLSDTIAQMKKVFE